MYILNSLNYKIDTEAFTLTSPQGDSINIRPKTCQLLIVLLKSKGSVVSKAEILNKVWHGSVVDEQVVFQSIKELRKIFSGHEVIKTLPKQGYIWLHNVTTDKTAENTVAIANIQSNKFLYVLALIALLIVVMLIVINSTNSTEPNQSNTSSIVGSVIILPTENLIVGNDHSWVRLGMMDQLIQRLPSNKQFGILQTDYVLQVLERAKLPLSHVSVNDIPDVFTVSGAELIVATKLSGSPLDYQLSYTLYRRKSYQRGVLFNKDSQALIDELTDIVASQLGNDLHINAKQYYADFNDEMLGVAIDLRLEGKFKQAIPLLTSIVSANPKNLTAQRLLIETYLATNEIDPVASLLEKSIAVARQLNDENELTRLLYFNGVYLYLTGEKTQSKASISEGLSIADANHDWLYKAYLTELNATFAIQSQQFSLAEQLYYEALSYHKILKCPLGQAQSWIYLSELAAMQNKTEKQKLAIDKAYNIATKRNLTNKIEEIDDIRNTL
ncbi:winged helix-turn-helix domain-containing protein [Thalassotalea sp. PLHSN55]|uniref:winged helix-turn-helix domain-containing protein n=1 Tax=Thalassotalea sp. PLHSN55 TaxID=3435888 RepID=UPI003F852985